jgi:hypothetical protein
MNGEKKTLGSKGGENQRVERTNATRVVKKISFLEKQPK